MNPQIDTTQKPRVDANTRPARQAEKSAPVTVVRTSDGETPIITDFASL